MMRNCVPSFDSDARIAFLVAGLHLGRPRRRCTLIVSGSEARLWAEYRPLNDGPHITGDGNIIAIRGWIIMGGGTESSSCIKAVVSGGAFAAHLLLTTGGDDLIASGAWE